MVWGCFCVFAGLDFFILAGLLCFQVSKRAEIAVQFRLCFRMAVRGAAAPTMD